MGYALGAVERAMKVRDVILQPLAGKLTWIQAADILGRSARSIRRLRLKFERYGVDDLYDRRRRTPSPKRAPVAEVQRLLALYREHYQGFNVRHFHHIARRQHQGRFCYAFVKKALQGAGLVAQQRPRGRHRRRREPRPCVGELLHLDGRRHHPLVASIAESERDLIRNRVIAGLRRASRRPKAGAPSPASRRPSSSPPPEGAGCRYAQPLDRSVSGGSWPYELSTGPAVRTRRAFRDVANVARHLAPRRRRRKDVTRSDPVPEMLPRVNSERTSSFCTVE